MTRGAALSSALLATLAEPATWALALAAFLIRGGIILVALPVVVLPTPVGIGNVVAPVLNTIAFGQVSMATVLGAVALGAGVVAWVSVGGLLAALLEAEAARIIARDEEVAAMTRLVRRREPRGVDVGRLDLALVRGLEAGRILVARLIAYVPLGIALAWGSIRLVVVAYRELTNPLDVATPVVIRVVRDVPEVIVVVGLAWMIGDIVGSLAARRVVLGADGTLRALGAAVNEVVRHPLATVARWGVPLALLLVVLVPSLLAASATWNAVRGAIGGPDATGLFIAILAFVTLWLIGLLLVAVVSAWRWAVWTVAVATAAPAGRRAGDVGADDASSRRHRGAVPRV